MSDKDTIYRQAAIDELFELYEYQRSIDPTEPADLVRQGIYLAEKKIEQLPSAELKHGKWHIENDSFVVLDVCDQCMKSVRHVAPFYNFCPHCGADMREEGQDD